MKMKKCFSGFLFTLLMFLVGINPFKSNSNNAIAAIVPPPACPQYLCKSISTYWIANTQDVVQFKTPVKGTVPLQWIPASSAMPNIFAVVSTETTPVIGGTATVTPYHYDTCIPTCGMDFFGNWQATQEVWLGATATVQKVDAPVFQTVCTKNPPNGNNEVLPQNNTNKSNPPLDPPQGPPPFPG